MIGILVGSVSMIPFFSGLTVDLRPLFTTGFFTIHPNDGLMAPDF